MDMQDKNFDHWLKNQLTAEIPLSKQHRRTAWEQIQSRSIQPHAVNTIIAEDEFVRVTASIARCDCDRLHARVWQWVHSLMTQERRYNKAHANSALYYKANPRYDGGLRLHSLEFMRQRWMCAF